MNPASENDAKKLARNVVALLRAVKKRGNTRIVLCPPFTFLLPVASLLGYGAELGAQNCHFEDSGAYTGEVSAKMLKSLKCRYVIVGHSERRNYFNEDSKLINKKLHSVLKNGLTPVLAVGEKEGESVKVIERQLKEALEGVSGAKAKNIIIAYEPVWAIGTGKSATADNAMSARIMIRKVLAAFYPKTTANKIPVLYGGSTDSKNIVRFTKDAQMDGALVGDSSLNAKEFIKMVEEIGK